MFSLEIQFNYYGEYHRHEYSPEHYPMFW